MGATFVRAGHPLRFVALVLLCAAYIQGPITKLLDFDGAIAEMKQFGLPYASAVAAIVIVFELAACTMILANVQRRLAALALAGFTLVATFIALRFWEMAPGLSRTMAMNAFFEHLGLIGGFLLVALVEPDGSKQ